LPGESPLSATWRPAITEKAVLVGIGSHIRLEDLDELHALATTAGAEPVARLIQAREEPDPTTYVGKGKVADIHSALHSTGADAVVFDAELTPGQLRTLEDRLGVKVIDRTALILDIFALHATSREGKTQVELAQLNYLLPRLRGWGEAMSRLGGGIGTRGPGETKLETDRQHIRRRITKLRREIDDLSRTRDLKRERRVDAQIPQIAIAGYTNAGKSSVMNAVTGAGVLVANQLFATLDPTTRRLRFPGGRAATLSDTVGFVGKLPHDLVEAFRSTLEEVGLASLVLHVADASNPAVEEQIKAVREVLSEIGAGDLPEVLALNKSDTASELTRTRLLRRFPDAICVSAKTGEGLEKLIAKVEHDLPTFPIDVTALIPYAREDLVAMLHREADLLEAVHEDDGTRIHAKVGERAYRAILPFVTNTKSDAT